MYACAALILFVGRRIPHLLGCERRYARALVGAGFLPRSAYGRITKWLLLDFLKVATLCTIIWLFNENMLSGVVTLAVIGWTIVWAGARSIDKSAEWAHGFLARHSISPEFDTWIVFATMPGFPSGLRRLAKVGIAIETAMSADSAPDAPSPVSSSHHLGAGEATAKRA